MGDVKAVILAGGQGSRFWPLSRMANPKQFLSINSSGESLIRATACRILPLAGSGNLVIATNELHTKLIKEHVPEAAIITEPFKRNTAASIALVALKLSLDGSDPALIVLPADHTVKEEEQLRRTLQSAVDIASEQDVLVTIGIPPATPHTGYGYICKGEALTEHGFRVKRFYEKPNLQRAKRYLEDGSFLWNSGMFVWRASVFLKAVEEFMPELYEGLQQIKAVAGSANESEVVSAVFERLSSVSVDFGIIEHARNCVVVEAGPIGWSDVGAWDAWADHFATDDQGNLSSGDVLVIDSENSVICGKDRMIAALGVKDMIIIDSGDALLICPRGRVQDVRKIVDSLEAQGRQELI